MPGMQPCWLCAVDPSNGALLATHGIQIPVIDMDPSLSFSASPSGTHILVQPTEHSGIVYGTPWLRKTCRLACPPALLARDPNPHIDWLGWSCSDQLVVIWHSKACVCVAIHSSHDGRLEAQHKAAGCWACVTEPQVAPAPRQPFLAFALQDHTRHEYECQSGHVLTLRTGHTSTFDFGRHVKGQFKVIWSWSPNDQVLAMAKDTRTDPPFGWSGSLLVWHLPTKMVLHETEGPGLPVWSADGEICAIALSDSDLEGILRLSGEHVGLHLEDSSQNVMPAETTGRGMAFFSISPCSTRLVRCGPDGPQPMHLEQ